MDRDDIIFNIVYIIIYAIFFILFNFLAVWLWGIIAVGIFGLPALSFWQMVGLRIVLGLILPSHISPNDVRRD